MKIYAQLAAKLEETGISKSMNPAARDGYAALWLWLSGGQRMERLSLDDVQLIPAELRLADAPLKRQATGFTLPVDPRDWVILARVSAGEPIRAGDRAVQSFVYPEPMLVWAGWRAERRSIVTGCINLIQTPTIVGLQLASGKNYGELGAADLTQNDADDDLLMVGQCLSRFYR